MIKIILNFLIFSTMYMYANSTIMEEKNIDGTVYYKVKASAEVMPNYDGNGQSTNTLSVTFYNLNGKISISNKTYKQIPNSYNDKVTVYYLIKKGEEGEQMYDVFFNKDALVFPQYSLVKDQQNYKEDVPLEHKSSTRYGFTYYIYLFLFFLILNGFMDDIGIPFKKDSKLYMGLSIVLILIFFIGLEKILHSGSICNQKVIETEGVIKYHINPYIAFKDCNGDNSRSDTNMKELAGKKEYSKIKIFYSPSTQDGHLDNRGHTFSYKVFLTKKEALSARETPLRLYFGAFMLIVFLYGLYFRKDKSKVPTGIHKVVVYEYTRNSQYFSKLFSVVKKEKFETNHFEKKYILTTSNSGNIIIMREMIMGGLISLAVAFGSLWVLSRFSLDDDIPSNEHALVIGLTIISFIVFVLSLYVAIKSIFGNKTIALFDGTKKEYTPEGLNIKFSFDKIYAYTIMRRIKKNFDTRDIVYYMLDIVLENGEVYALAATVNHLDELLDDAKLLSSYTGKPIYDFGDRDIANIDTNWI